MTFETRFTWEKLAIELRLLQPEDVGSLVPLSIGIQSVLWPKDNVEAGFRQVQFLGFEILKTCEGLPESDRWESLRQLIFTDKGFQLSSGTAQDLRPADLLMKTVLDNRAGHPIAIAFLILHLTHYLDIPMSLIQARHYFLLKWVRSGKTFYMDLLNECKVLTDQELIKVLNLSSSTLDKWDAKQLMSHYLELLKYAFERAQDLNLLHQIYTLILHMDEGNTVILGQRALLRQKLGFSREALSDLKRYFSFIEKAHAPIELQQAWMALEAIPEPTARNPAEILH